MFSKGEFFAIENFLRAQGAGINFRRPGNLQSVNIGTLKYAALTRFQLLGA